MRVTGTVEHPGVEFPGTTALVNRAAPLTCQLVCEGFRHSNLYQICTTDVPSKVWQMNTAGSSRRRWSWLRPARRSTMSRLRRFWTSI